VAAAATALLLPVAAPADAEIVARPLVVDRAGPVRVSLPAALHSADAGYEVVAPDGTRLPVRLLVLGGGAGSRSARVVRVAETVDGWSVTIDAGATTPAHQALRLPLAVTGLAEVQLEASDDGARWTALGSAGLFRLGAAPELQGSALAYPATTARYLRLRWPRAAEFPRLQEVQLESVRTAAEELPLPKGACAADGPRRTTCDLGQLGERAVEGVLVTLPAGRAGGWRLYAAADGRWELLSEGSWAPRAEAAPRRVPASEGAGRLRLELWGDAQAPGPLGVAVRALPMALDFVAPAAGTYELRSAAGLPRPRRESAAGDGDVQWATPGEARGAGPVPALDVPAGAALPKARFTRRWPVLAAAAAGEAVRLPLPPAVETTARGDLGDLRLASGGRQVPYLLEEAPTPVRAGSWERLVLRPQGDGTSAAELASPAGGSGRYATLVLRVPPRPLRRQVRLLRDVPAEGVGSPTRATLAQAVWHCEPLPPLPCELALPAVIAGRGSLRIEIVDGDNAPLGQLAAELWRSRRQLLFPWPGEPPALLAGAPGLAPPDYDLAAVASELRARPATSARLGAEMQAWDGAPARWPRWAVLGSLGLAALVLLLLLARALPRMPQSGESV
jgi:hypothetical protein